MSWLNTTAACLERLWNLSPRRDFCDFIGKASELLDFA